LANIHLSIAASHRILLHCIASPPRIAWRRIAALHRILLYRVASPCEASRRRIASPCIASHCIASHRLVALPRHIVSLHRIASQRIASRPLASSTFAIQLLELVGQCSVKIGIRHFPALSRSRNSLYFTTPVPSTSCGADDDGGGVDDKEESEPAFLES
jgi:hypothetical protein